jgi:uncharacterized membrane protein YfcA
LCGALVIISFLTHLILPPTISICLSRAVLFNSASNMIVLYKWALPNWDDYILFTLYAGSDTSNSLASTYVSVTRMPLSHSTAHYCSPDCYLTSINV